jgi:hypothetical protein
MGKAGGMAEWSKAAVLKTVNRKVRGFESCSLRQNRKYARGGNFSSSGEDTTTPLSLDGRGHNTNSSPLTGEVG